MTRDGYKNWGRSQKVDPLFKSNAVAVENKSSKWEISYHSFISSKVSSFVNKSIQDSRETGGPLSERLLILDSGGAVSSLFIFLKKKRQMINHTL